MLPTTLILLSLLLMLGFFALRGRDTVATAPRVAVPPPRRSRPHKPPTPPRAGPARTALAGLDFSSALPAKAPTPEVAIAAAPDLSQKFRNRYIAARFPGMFGGEAELAQPERAVRAARLYFEEAKADRAQELLELASRISPAEPSLGLAQLEIAYLTRDAAGYVQAARAFKARFPAAAQWPEIVRLGQLIAPDESAFAGAQAARAHDHYGPWPDTPNWIQASWDLTSEVLAADFHLAIIKQLGAKP